MTRPVQQHQTVLRADQQVHAPERRAENLRIEALLVFADLRRVAGRIMLRRWRHVHVHMALATRRAARTSRAEAEREEASLFLLEGKRIWMH